MSSFPLRPLLSRMMTEVCRLVGDLLISLHNACGYSMLHFKHTHTHNNYAELDFGDDFSSLFFISENATTSLTITVALLSPQLGVPVEITLNLTGGTAIQSECIYTA